MFYQLGVGIVSLCLIALQVGLTRIFSNMVWYHLSFLTISLAMLGFSLGGLILLFFPRLIRDDQDKTVPLCAVLFSFAIAICIVYIAYSDQIFTLFSTSFDQASSAYTMWGSKPGIIIYFLLLLFLFVLCFAFSGLVIATAITQKAHIVSRIYFSNLIGSGFGCLIIIGLLSQLGALRAMLSILAFSALAPICFGCFRKLHRGFSLVALVLLFGSLILLFTVNKDTIFVKSIITRRDVAENLRVYREWNSFSVVDFYRPYGQGQVFTYEGLWGLSPNYKGKRPEPIKVIIDSWAVTSINQVDADTFTSPIFDYLPANLPYAIKERPRVLIMGAGGGIDVLSALHYNAKRIVGVEINPSIVKAVKHRFREFAGRIYDHPKVRIIVGEGRHVISRDRNRYDIIQLSGVDTLSGAQASSYSFSESYLYTSEAFDEYFAHLTKDGAISFLRFAFDPPREMLRLMTTATEALERLKVSDPSRHMVLIHSNSLVFASLIIKKLPFTEVEIKHLKKRARRNGFSILYCPGETLGHAYETFIHSPDRNDFYDSYPFRIEPVSDDDPFFFNYTKLKSLFISQNFDHYWLYWIGQTILFYGALFILLLSLLFIGIPLLKTRFSRRAIKGRYRYIVYFLCLGLAFMGIEILLMQRFTLFLGQPIYALALVLFCLLIFAGLGSFTTEKIKDAPPKSIVLCFGVLLAVLALTYFLTGLLFSALLDTPLMVRIVVSILLLAPPSFFMGFPFPLVVQHASKHSPDMVAWGFSINGYASVLGSFLSVIMALFFGFKVVFGTACLLYLIAGLTLLSLRRECDVRT